MGVMYMFDLKTGKRFKDKLSVPQEYGGHDPIRHVHWYYKPDEGKPILKSLKIDGFKRKDELKQVVSTKFSDIIKKRTTETIDAQKQEGRVAPRSLESFIKSLGNKSKKEGASEETVSALSSEVDSVHQSLYLILYAMSKG